ncbi:MAG: helix-turn-helix transcriptional regulator [Thalassospira sp.]|uniref:helix-turn-helix domain-containing protein n=1 Tax=Thalassospira sp. TaxID=1912094 RepID=UPI001B1B5009|nr:helix-turn-helix transcriptional regulator [Thalassospira sp.]MBO6824468.1 helix-turn-helix transcriptional regulator [Pseudomonadales bacterium]MBO6842634.1 helix-turn-helix transcriptional regulator [Thalassospira sp.]
MDNRITELRKAKGLTIKRLAELVGTSNQQISHLEKGHRRLTLEWMERIAEALECHPSDLLSGGTRLENDRERAMIELFRGLSDEQQEAFLQATAALAKPIEKDEEKLKSG